MLFKAIFTGGVLSVLAGSMVYFGTEGADARLGGGDLEVRVEETELAGAADVSVGDVEGLQTGEIASGVRGVETDVEVESVSKTEETATEETATEETATEETATEETATEETAFQDPPREKSKPKTKWLDQYLKKSMPGGATDSKANAVEVEEEVESEMDVDAEVDVEDVENPAVDADAMRNSHADKKKRKRIRFRKRLKDSATGSYVISKETRTETQGRDGIDIDAIDIDALNLDGDIDVEALKDQLGLDGDNNVEIRVIKKVEDKSSHKMRNKPTRKTIDYDSVLKEAKKLLVVDMKNQAVLEIIDYAVDNKDMTKAADFVQELSTPELRDTARARIGGGLARCGKAEAAFAVIDELEIDELAAPIRLEIITALMATRQERRAAGIQN